MKRLILVFSLALMLIPASLMGQAKHKDYTLPEEPNRAKYIDFPSLDKGLWFAVQATPAFFSTGGGFGIHGELIAGYRFGEFIKVGAGIAPGIIGSSFNMPIFLDARGNIISQESRMAVPYWNVDIGYSVGQVYKGFYASPTVGIRIGMPRNDFLAGLTYMMQIIPAIPNSSVVHGIGLKLGFEF